MDPYVKALNTKRYIIEDSITKVTSDGKPHQMMTLVAGLSGLLAAVLILTIVVALVSCRKSRRENNCKGRRLSIGSPACRSPKNCLHDYNTIKNVSISPYNSGSTVAEKSSCKRQPIQHPLVAVICSGNLKGNLNSAFVGDELDLVGNFINKKSHKVWNNDFTVQPSASSNKESNIVIEKY